MWLQRIQHKEAAVWKAAGQPKGSKIIRLPNPSREELADPWKGRHSTNRGGWCRISNIFSFSWPLYTNTNGSNSCLALLERCLTNHHHHLYHLCFTCLQPYWSLRPISNLPFLSKILEKSVAQQLHIWTKITSLSGISQVSVSAKGTETALIKVSNGLLVALTLGPAEF